MKLISREQEISDATGFDAGIEFATRQAVMEYLTVANMENMYGANDLRDAVLCCATRKTSIAWRKT